MTNQKLKLWTCVGVATLLTGSGALAAKVVLRSAILLPVAKVAKVAKLEVPYLPLSPTEPMLPCSV